VRVALGVSLVALGATGAACGSGSDGYDAGLNLQQSIERRIEGTWKLASYKPESELSPVMLLAMGSGTILVRIDGGHLRGASAGLTFDRRYRVTEAARESFKIFIADEVGVEVESWCRFDEAGRLHFYAQTAPWRGRGVLERQGAAPAP
jgi:hypothetical protein